MRKQPKVRSYARPKKHNWMLFYMHANKDGNQWGNASTTATSASSTFSAKTLDIFVEQIKKLYGYDQVVVTGWKAIRGPR